MRRAISTTLVFGLVIVGGIAAAPINTDTALPVHKGEILWREQIRFMQASDSVSKMRVTAVPSVFVFGVTEKLALIGMAPFLDKELAMDGIERRSSGLGDTTLLGRYQVFQSDRPGETRRAQVLAGVKLPTGDNEKRDAFGILPRPLQPGSGSVDGMIATVFTVQRLKWQADFDVAYRKNGEHDGFRFGSSVTHNAALQYRLWPGELPEHGIPDYVYGVLELNGVWAYRDELQGTTIRDSGGYTLFVSPGVQYVTKRWIAEASVQLPLVRNLNGAQPEPDYTVAAGFRIQY